MSSTKLSVRNNPANPNHHLWNNHGKWWCHLTLHHDDGTKGRDIKSPLELPPRILLSKQLFTINWADSAPGYSWPEAYWATELPYFDRVVVTASADSPDAHGYCDLAIGSFDPGEDRVAAIADLVKGFWSYQASEENQPEWAYLLDTGEIDKATAESWAKEVWADETTDELEPDL